ncbi:hypothetical protein Deba_2755 [Desulfarculus baarsii DSM 2075]|uniref:Uncharacterized protein n=2 Tax=Desulfarculus baarsii TaxID=453230 RepID=E1QKL6_DESB2|nr:hypothetical protein Deba_2755 [Desulfarculus baarsii DSM 2075]
MTMDRQTLLARREQCAQELAEARAAMPFHSARPWQLERLERAEEELAEAERLLAQCAQEASDAK